MTTQPLVHLARITCGQCAEETTIALGHASAIACGKCDTTIILGEAPLPEDFSDPSLNMVLDHLGFTHEKAPLERNVTGDRHDLRDWGGTLVATLNCNDTWAYLRNQGLYPRQKAVGDLKEQADCPGEIHDPS